MKIIDAHVHYSNIAAFHETAQTLAHIDYTGKGLQEEFRRSGVIAGVGMGVTETVAGAFPDSAALNPMLLDLSGILPVNLFTCVGINPLTLHLEGQLEALEQSLQRTDVVGIKLYAGYYHFNVGMKYMTRSISWLPLTASRWSFMPD